jgi:hypothetical protein
MLIIRCAACRKKLWRYDKIGKGEVLRCHKSRITRDFGNSRREGGRWCCICGKDVGVDRGRFVTMIAKAFTCSGTKRNG